MIRNSIFNPVDKLNDRIDFLFENKIKKSSLLYMNKNYLEVPFNKKDEAKLNQCFWDMDTKKWYYYDDNVNDFINKYSKLFIDIPFDKKDDFKQLGAKWDVKHKKWYTYSGNIELLGLLK